MRSYPWVVETMVNRVSMGKLEQRLEQTQQKLESLPSHLIQAINESVAAPIQAIQSSQGTIDNLTVEQRKNSVIEASLRQSGWRGVNRSTQNARADGGRDCVADSSVSWGDRLEIIGERSPDYSI